MGRSASEASTPLRRSLRALSAFWAVREPSAPNAVELRARLFRAFCCENIRGSRGHRNLSPPGESLSDWIDRWDYEARILEVDGILLAAPHTAP
jgi:hypothetical protein